MKKPIFIILVVLTLDQILKIWVKTTFYLGESHAVLGHWFYLNFTENEGMAFGMRLGGNYGKLMLSLFRIAAVVAIGWWLNRAIRRGAGLLLIVCTSLIMAGALGNIIDSAFYGMIFSESSMMHVAGLFPPGGGYGAFLHGNVVDMLYFPLINTQYPSWFPFVGGERFEFFAPVFNIADSSITTGVLLLIFFQKKIFSPIRKTEDESESSSERGK